MEKQMKITVYIFMLLVSAAVFSGCKSTPEPVEEPVIVEKTEAEKNAESLFNEIAKIRMQVVEVKGDAQFPKLFQSADSTTDTAKNAYNGKNFADAEKYAQTALTQYRTLLNLVQIAAVKAKINAHDLQDYDAENYRKAEELTAQVTALYTQDPETAYRLSKEALQCYESVSNAGFSVLMKDAKQKAEEARERCDSVKAAASMKDAYTQEVNRCRYAAIAADNQKYEQAYNGYITAAKEFNTMYETVKIKRAAALAAMEKAKARQEASTKLAENADKEAPLPENAEGFSREPIEVTPIKRSNEPAAEQKPEAAPADKPHGEQLPEPAAEQKPEAAPADKPQGEQLPEPAAEQKPEAAPADKPHGEQLSEPAAEQKPEAAPADKPQQAAQPETIPTTHPETAPAAAPNTEPAAMADSPAEGEKQ
ncbi:MAG: hypothetical protein ACTTH8_06865 [Treponema sp.]